MRDAGLLLLPQISMVQVSMPLVSMPLVSMPQVSMPRAHGCYSRLLPSEPSAR